MFSNECQSLLKPYDLRLKFLCRRLIQEGTTIVKTHRAAMVPRIGCIQRQLADFIDYGLWHQQLQTKLRQHIMQAEKMDRRYRRPVKHQGSADNNRSDRLR